MTYILSTPLADISEADRWCWHYNSHRRYTTSFAYPLACEVVRCPLTNARSMNAFDWIIWKSIWKLKDPPKGPHFIWKCLHDVLITVRQTLIQRQCSLYRIANVYFVGQLQILIVAHWLVGCSTMSTIFILFSLLSPSINTQIVLF